MISNLYKGALISYRERPEGSLVTMLFLYSVEHLYNTVVSFSILSTVSFVFLFTKNHVFIRLCSRALPYARDWLIEPNMHIDLWVIGQSNQVCPVIKIRFYWKFFPFLTT